MAQFEFWLSAEDTDRVFALKAEAGKADMTGNDFARELLEKTLHKLHPETVRHDEETGDMILRKKGGTD